MERSLDVGARRRDHYIRTVDCETKREVPSSRRRDESSGPVAPVAAVWKCRGLCQSRVSSESPV